MPFPPLNIISSYDDRLTAMMNWSLEPYRTYNQTPCCLVDSFKTLDANEAVV